MRDLDKRLMHWLQDVVHCDECNKNRLIGCKLAHRSYNGNKWVLPKQVFAEFILELVRGVMYTEEHGVYRLTADYQDLKEKFWLEGVKEKAFAFKQREISRERNAHNLKILQEHGGHLPTRPKRKQNPVNYNESVENSVQDSEDEDSSVATTDDMTSLKKDQINFDEETYEREEVELDMEQEDLDRKMTPEEQKEYFEEPTNFVLPLKDTPTKSTERLSKVFVAVSQLAAGFPFERTHPVSMTNTQTNLVSNNYEKKILTQSPSTHEVAKESEETSMPPPPSKISRKETSKVTTPNKKPKLTTLKTPPPLAKPDVIGSMNSPIDLSKREKKSSPRKPTRKKRNHNSLFLKTLKS